MILRNTPRITRGFLLPRAAIAGLRDLLVLFASLLLCLAFATSVLAARSVGFIQQVSLMQAVELAWRDWSNVGLGLLLMLVPILLVVVYFCSRSPTPRWTCILLMLLPATPFFFADPVFFLEESVTLLTQTVDGEHLEVTPFAVVQCWWLVWAFAALSEISLPVQHRPPLRGFDLSIETMASE